MDTTFTKWSVLRTKIEQELDLNEETFVTQAELMDYGNSAIGEAEKMVLEIYQDYFLTSYQPSIVTGTAGYPMPPSVWGNKIRMVVYRQPGTPPPIVYQMRRIPLHQVPTVDPQDDYRYMITQAVPQTTDGPVDGGVQFVVVPTPRETSSNITVWYLRYANRLADDNSQIDIPEATAFIEWYIRVKVYRKELHPLLQDAEAELERQRQIFRETLDQMTPDETDVIEPDMSFYWDFYYNGYNGGAW